MEVNRVQRKRIPYGMSNFASVRKDSYQRVEQLRLEAIDQAHRYADTEVVKQGVGSTQLHKIVVVYRGMEMVVCEEIAQT